MSRAGTKVRKQGLTFGMKLVRSKVACYSEADYFNIIVKSCILKFLVISMTLTNDNLDCSESSNIYDEQALSDESSLESDARTLVTC